MLAAIFSEFKQRTQAGQRLATISVGCLAGLLGSGSLLVIVSRGRILSACLEGLGYIASLVLFYIVYRGLASRRLATVRARRK
jgi:hypothetical protein